MQIISALIVAGADLRFTDCEFGGPVQAAARNGQLYMAKFLIEEGASVDAEGGALGRALQAASWHGNLDLVKILLSNGADIAAGGGDFGSALSAAMYKGHSNVVSFLLDRRAKIDSWKTGQRKILWDTRLKPNGLVFEPPNQTYSLGNGPLVHTVARRDINMVLVLLTHGANVNGQISQTNSSKMTVYTTRSDSSGARHYAMPLINPTAWSSILY